VKIVYGRQEDVEASTKRHPSRVEIASGCDRDGTLRAVSIRVVFDGGAYVTLSPVVLSRGALHACGAYRWEDVRSRRSPSRRTRRRTAPSAASARPRRSGRSSGTWTASPGRSAWTRST
jgi:Xanthine dehydrogenase, molybdopterin-binding subunit B